MQPKLTKLLSSAALVLCFLPTLAAAHGPTLMIGSTAAGSGALAIEFEFTSVARTGFSTPVGPDSLYTGASPSLAQLTVDTAPLFALAASTQVSLEVTRVDEGKTAVKIGPTVLDAVGESAVIGTTPFTEQHPEWQLLLNLPEGEFGEGDISFKLTTTSGSYTSSDEYTLHLSNGVLGAVDYDVNAYDSTSVKCQQTVGIQTRTFVQKKLAILRACLDKAEVARAKESLLVAPADLAAKQAAAEKACADATGSGPDSGTMLGKIDKARQVAFSAIQKKCGTPNPPSIPASASGDFSDDDMQQHLGLAGCRAEELAGAEYGGGREAIEGYAVRASQGGDLLGDHLSCLKPTAAL